MGRGRAKAKQTKVARELKYHSPNTDLAALQRELAGSAATTKPAEDLDELDEYDQYDDQDSEDEDDEDPNWAVRRTR